MLLLMKSMLSSMTRKVEVTRSLLKRYVGLQFAISPVTHGQHRQLSASTRYAESRAAYREVQERHTDIQRIENTLEELAQLFNDVSAFPF